MRAVRGHHSHRAANGSGKLDHGAEESLEQVLQIAVGAQAGRDLGQGAQRRDLVTAVRARGRISISQIVVTFHVLQPREPFQCLGVPPDRPVIHTLRSYTIFHDGSFSPEKAKVLARSVKAFEIKLSQGAKPGKGGVLPGAKVTEEIAS
ncbi:MAG: hypothetical protein K2Y16_02140 [Burkholderiales bacterium]|nr:hypothetical protein [Burkholderiales bacterium]